MLNRSPSTPHDDASESDLSSFSIPDTPDDKENPDPRNRSTTSFSSLDSFDIHILKNTNFASPNIPRINRQQMYGTHSSVPFANLNEFTKQPRSRGRSEHMEEDEEPSPPIRIEVALDAACGNSTLSPHDDHGRFIHRGVSHYDDPSSSLLRGDYQLRDNQSLGWAEAGTPGTNHTRKLRQLSTAFDQYVRSRRKVCLITFGMVAAFTFLCSMTSRLAGGPGNNNNGNTPAAAATTTPTSASNEITVDDPASLPTSTDLAAWYLSICYLSAVCSCVGSYLFMFWVSLRKRVTFSMLLMLVPLIVFILVETSNNPIWSNNLGYPIIVMIGCGTSWGLFLPSILSLLTPHGPNTKLWLTFGLPFGTLVVEMLLVVCEGAVSTLGSNAVIITASIPLSLITIGLVIHIFRVPNVHVDHNGDSLYSVCSVLRNVCLWIRGPLLLGCLSLFVSSACFSMFSVGAVSMALEKHTTVALFGGESQWVVPQSLVMGMYASFGLIGGIMGRKMAYMVQTTSRQDEWKSECLVRLPLTWVVVTLLGGSVIAGAFKVNWGILLPLGVFLLGYGQGFVENQMIRYIDSNIPREANLASFTLLVGSSLGGSFIVWNMPVWVRVASWMGAV